MSTVDLSLKNPTIPAGSGASGTIVWTVPATWHHFKASDIVQVIAGSAGALAAGALAVVDDDTFALVAPDATGLYAVTPGQNLLLLYSFFNVTADGATASAYQAVVTLNRVN